jgi:hypothetical protein
VSRLDGIVSRLINPREDVLRDGWQREGWVPQRELTRRDDEAVKYGTDPLTRVIVQETFVGFRDNLAANSTTGMHVDFRTSTSTVVTQGQGLDVPAQARILLVRIISNADVTAGTATPQVSITESGGTDTYLFTECELSTTTVRTKSARFDWANAVQIGKDATFMLQIVTSVGYTPITNDYSVRLVLGYESWVSS